MSKRYYCCSYCDGNYRKNFPGYQPEDEFEAPYKSKRKKKAKPKFKGCPARKDENRKAHIYVWVEYNGWDYGYKRNDKGDLIYVKKPETWWDYECVGCGHKHNRRWAWSKPPEKIYSVVKDAGEFTWRMN